MARSIGKTSWLAIAFPGRQCRKNGYTKEKARNSYTQKTSERPTANRVPEKIPIAYHDVRVQVREPTHVMLHYGDLLLHLHTDVMVRYGDLVWDLSGTCTHTYTRHGSASAREDRHSVAWTLFPHPIPTPMHRLHFHLCSSWHERYCPTDPTPTPPQMTETHILLRVSTCVNGFSNFETTKKNNNWQQPLILVLFFFNGGYHFCHWVKWVCLKIGYIPNYSHLIGIMIINHWV